MCTHAADWGIRRRDVNAWCLTTLSTYHRRPTTKFPRWRHSNKKYKTLASFGIKLKETIKPSSKKKKKTEFAFNQYHVLTVYIFDTYVSFALEIHFSDLRHFFSTFPFAITDHLFIMS